MNIELAAGTCLIRLDRSIPTVQWGMRHTFLGLHACAHLSTGICLPEQLPAHLLDHNSYENDFIVLKH